MLYDSRILLSPCKPTAFDTFDKFSLRKTILAAARRSFFPLTRFAPSVLRDEVESGEAIYKFSQIDLSQDGGGWGSVHSFLGVPLKLLREMNLIEEARLAATNYGSTNCVTVSYLETTAKPPQVSGDATRDVCIKFTPRLS